MDEWKHLSMRASILAATMENSPRFSKWLFDEWWEVIEEWGILNNKYAESIREENRKTA